ncbi:MAG: DUF971 domain-containing protein [Oligoflexales bacterium]|nr:DUF971 domain-containing protein [Oligoflexales bacterium]
MLAAAVKEIWQADERTLGILWTDGRESRLDVVTLRRDCPCAACIDEKTGKKILKSADVPDSVRPLGLNSIGRYALSIQFDDRHNTGIYSFDRLRAYGFKS